MMASPRIVIVAIDPGMAARVDVHRLSSGLKKAMTDTVSEGQRFIAEYPTQTLTYTGYKRTGTLKRSWSSKVGGTTRGIEGIVGSNSNIAPYNRFVQGHPGTEQKDMFRRAKWRNTYLLGNAMQEDLEKNVQNVMDHILD